jgi:hypothetical protein
MARNAQRRIARVETVDEINILQVNVVERDGDKLICEIEVDASFVLEVSVDLEGAIVGPGAEDYEPGGRFITRMIVSRPLLAEVSLQFDPAKAEDLKVESIHTRSLRLDDRISQQSGDGIGLQRSP